MDKIICNCLGPNHIIKSMQLCIESFDVTASIKVTPFFSLGPDKKLHADVVKRCCFLSWKLNNAQGMYK